MTSATLSPTAPVVFTAPGRINVGGNQTVSSLAGPAGTTWSLGTAGSLTEGGDNTSTTFGVITGTGGLTKTGYGTFTLIGPSTYTGSTTIQTGALDLSFSTAGAPAANILPSGSPITLGSATTLVLIGSNGAADSQTLGNPTINTGAAITLTPNGASSLGLTLGNTWTRGPGGTLFVDLSAGSAASLTSSPVSAGTIIPYALVKDTTATGMATVNGSGKVVRYDDTTGTTLAVASNNAATNFTSLGSVYTSGTLSWTNGGGLTTRSVNTLTIDTTNNGGTIDMGASSNVLTLTSGAVLFKGPNNATLQGGQLGAAASEVIVHQAGTGTLTVASPISSGTGSLTKDGPGTLVLTAANAYTGPTTVAAGSLQGSVAAIPTAVTLQNSANVNYNQASGGTLANVVSGNGSFTKSGAGLLALTAIQTYSGATNITAGTLQLGANVAMPNIAAAGNLTVWLNATALSATNNQSITTWTNQATVGSVGNFSGGTAAYLSSGGTAFNNLPVVDFNGASVLNNTTNFGNNVTVMYVGGMDGTQNARLVGGYNNNWLLGYWSTAQDKAYFNGWLTSSATTPTAGTAAKVYEGTIDSAGNGNFYSSGTLLAGPASGFSGPNGLVLGGYSTGNGSEDSKGRVGELFVFNTVLNTANRKAVEAYLENKWLGTSLASADLPAATAVNISAAGANPRSQQRRPVDRLADRRARQPRDHGKRRR